MINKSPANDIIEVAAKTNEISRQTSHLSYLKRSLVNKYIWQGVKTNYTFLTFKID